MGIEVVTWSSAFGGEDFWKSTNQKEELPVVAIFVNESGRNEQSLQRTFHTCFLTGTTGDLFLSA
jgi:hypothetical protein